MLLPILLISLFFVLLGYFLSHLKWEKKISIKFGVPLLIVSCMIAFVTYDTVSYFQCSYFTYEISVNSKHLESFFIDFDTPEQYEEWFCPDKQSEWPDTLEMSKTTGTVSPYDRVELRYCKDIPYAKSWYDRIVEHGGDRTLPYRPAIKISEDYEYAIGDAYAYKEHNGFWFERDGEYNTDVAIRYKNVIFIFSEFPEDKRESRIGEAIDQLWADYERYREEMNMPP